MMSARRCHKPGIEAVSADTGFAFGRHTHNQFGIGLIDRGAQRSLSGRGIVESRVGDIITVNPGEVHDGVPIGKASRAWRMLYFDLNVVHETVFQLTDGRSSVGEFTHPVISGGTPAPCFHALFRALTGNDSRETLRTDELLLLFLAGLLQAPRQSGEGIPGGIALARQMIDAEPNMPLSLAELADAAGLSRYQLLRGFAHATGFTPHAYLVQRRLQMARRLIAGGQTLAEAALASGFADQSHMTRLFRRNFGMSPGVYAAGMG